MPVLTIKPPNEESEEEEGEEEEEGGEEEDEEEEGEEVGEGVVGDSSGMQDRGVGGSGWAK